MFQPLAHGSHVCHNHNPGIHSPPSTQTTHAARPDTSGMTYWPAMSRAPSRFSRPSLHSAWIGTWRQGREAAAVAWGSHDIPRSPL